MSGLRELAMPTGDTDSYALCTFLTCLCNALQSSPNIILYDMEVAYLNKQTLDNDVERQLSFFKNEFQLQQEAAMARGSPLPAQAFENFKNELKEIEDNISNCGLVTNAARFYKATKCNYFLVASAPNRCWIRSQAFKNLPIGPQLLDALQKHQERRADWHAYAIRITNRKMYIYDPSYVSGSVTRLKDYPFGQRALDLRNELRKAEKKIEEIWIGGGGNSKGECRTMACQWLRGEIISDIGEAEDLRVPVVWSQISV